MKAHREKSHYPHPLLALLLPVVLPCHFMSLMSTDLKLRVKRMEHGSFSSSFSESIVALVEVGALTRILFWRPFSAPAKRKYVLTGRDAKRYLWLTWGYQIISRKFSAVESVNPLHLTCTSRNYIPRSIKGMVSIRSSRVPSTFFPCTSIQQWTLSMRSYGCPIHISLLNARHFCRFWCYSSGSTSQNFTPVTE